MAKIKIKGSEVTIITADKENFISITDIAKHKNSEATGLVISHWLSTRYTIEFMGLWEKMHNPNFNVTEFRNIKNQSGSNGFVLSSKNWITKTNVTQLVCLANLENLNAIFIKEKIPQNERLQKLNEIAIEQMLIISSSPGVKRLKK